MTPEERASELVGAIKTEPNRWLRPFPVAVLEAQVTKAIRAAIREAVAEEREICATYAAATPHIAAAIRARGKP